MRGDRAEFGRGRAATVARVNSSAVRTGRDMARRWQLRPWPNDPSACLVVFLDHLATPTADDLRAAVDQARRRGAHTLRTSALFPRAAEVATSVGFEPIDTLVLLRLQLDAGFDSSIDARFGATVNNTRQLWRWQHGRAASIDVDAFGDLWGNDAASLADIRDATPIHRARAAGDRRALAGFAISGAAGDNGYLQRLAVATAARRQGFARELVLDAVTWMRRSGNSAAYVNTGLGNTPALALYEGLGFEPMPERLTIAECRVRA